MRIEQKCLHCGAKVIVEVSDGYNSNNELRDYVSKKINDATKYHCMVFDTTFGEYKLKINEQIK